MLKKILKKSYLNVLISSAVFVERDERRAGVKEHLNFGHTIGHGIEKLHNFRVFPHGEAVGIGMLMISGKSAKRQA